MLIKPKKRCNKCLKIWNDSFCYNRRTEIYKQERQIDERHPYTEVALQSELKDALFELPEKTTVFKFCPPELSSQSILPATSDAGGDTSRNSEYFLSLELSDFF